jgi:hypothetical protein
MNVIAKPKPFPKRKTILPQPTGSPETFHRFVVAHAQALMLRGDALVIAGKRWPADRRLSQVIRAAQEPPADLSNTPALAATMTSDFVESLQPVSAAAQLMRQGLALSFDRYASITIPDFIGLDAGPPPFVAPGAPAPVGELTADATVLEPRKLEFIVTISRDMLLGSNAEKLIGDALRTKVAFGLDQALFDALPGDEGRPPGLRSYNARLPESTSLNNANAAMMDVSRLVGASEAIGGTAPLYFIARSRRMAALRLMLNRAPPNMVFLASAAGQALPESVLIGVAPRALASAVGLPEIELVESATVEMNDAPGSPDLMRGQRVHSLFQSDTLGIKVRIPAAWALRHPAGANWITCLWPSDVGGGDGGLPEAPFDEFSYGRRQGGWEPVAPDVTALGAHVRLRDATGNRWEDLSPTLANTAPLDSPIFIGSPQAPTPPNGDASNRLATTQFVADNAGSGGGDGVPEIPAAFEVYARERFVGGLADWTPISATFARLLSPAFSGTPTAPTPPLGDSSTRLSTTEYIGREFLHRNGGSLTGPLIGMMGGSVAAVSLGVGDNATGFYRAGAALCLSLGGAIHTQFLSNETMMVMRLNMATQPIQNVADATMATDAMNRRASDARYLQTAVGGIVNGPILLFATPVVDNDVVNKRYVDQRRAPSLLFDIPNDHPITAAGGWQPIYGVPYAIPRGGVSLVMVSLSCNISGAEGIMFIGARINSLSVTSGPREGPERRVWAYGVPTPPMCCGFTVNLYAEVSGDNPVIQIDLRALDGGTPAPARNFTVLGGDNVAVSARSQILITDLGPRPSAQDESEEPSHDEAN